MSSHVTNDRNISLISENSPQPPNRNSHSTEHATAAPNNDNEDSQLKTGSQNNSKLLGQQLPENHGDRSSGPINDPSGTQLDSSARQFLWTWLVSLITVGWVIFTICFAYNCTLVNPFSISLLFSKPENTILMLNILSHGTIILLKDLTSSGFEAVRWAFASSKKDVSASNFIGLSRATHALGVLGLVFGRSGSHDLGKDGCRLWGLQRIFLILLHAFIGIALLTNISFVSSWRPVQQQLFEGAGIGPINVSIALHDPQPIVFWTWFYGLVVSPNYITTIPLNNPSQCADGLCASYFLPGATYNLTAQVPPLEQYTDATALFINNLTGYQLEFYPLDNTTELNDAVCEAYGVDSAENSVAILICLKRSGNSLLAGFSCINDFLTLVLNVCFSGSYCLSNNSWQNEITYYTNVTISKRQATVVVSRADNTTLDIPTISAPEPTNYNPNDFFPIYNVAMNVASNPAILPYLTSVASQVVIANLYDVQSLLRQFIAVPIGLYNDPTSLGIYPPENQNITGHIALNLEERSGALVKGTKYA